MARVIAWFEELGKADGRRQRRQPGRAGSRRAAGAARVRRHRRRLPVGDGRGRGARRAAGDLDEARAHADDPVALAESAGRLRSLVHKAGVPASVQDEVLAAYHRLGTDVPVAVRSSATAEDTAGTSFAGMHETFANVVGDAAVIERLSSDWPTSTSAPPPG